MDILGERGLAVVVEDDADARNLLVAILSQAGFNVRSAAGGREGVELVRIQQVTVVTVDVGLPDIDGFEVVRRIRQFSDAHIVMVSGRTEEADMLTAFHSGADDYIIKPFRPLELRARVAAVTRRPRQQAAGTPSAHSDSSTPTLDTGQGKGVLQHNGLALNHTNRTVVARGFRIELTRSEFDILHELLRAAGAVRSRATLVRILHGGHDGHVKESDERAIDVHITNLRRKLGEDPSAPLWLETVRGVGYRLARSHP